MTRTNPLPAAIALAFLAPTAASACACGCGLFDVGNGTVTPVASDSGLSVWLRYDRIDQDQNHEHGAQAPAADNTDKRIQTSFITLGGEYKIARTFTMMAELPFIKRNFTTTGADGTGNPLVETVPLNDIGDALVRLTYSGFSPTLTTGLSLAVKLPTGRTTSPVDRYGAQPYDRDTLPGTGSTDLQVGGYHVGAITPRLKWFGQAQYRFAVATRDGYRPGNELNGGLGVSFDLADRPGHVGVTPTLQLLGTLRAHDTGPEADFLNSGFRRLLIAPGVRVRLTRKLSVYGDVEVPIAQYVNAANSVALEGTAGQLVAPVQFNFQVNYGF